MVAKVIPIRDAGELTSELQDALYEVICKERFEVLTLAQTIGILEFLKWNLINGA